MAAHLLHSLTEDNPDLQKQLGCMTGIFQLFDRQHIVSGRRIVGHNQRRVPQGNSFYKTGSNNAYHRTPSSEMSSKRSVYEKQRHSFESARVSFSSSSCSSLSSLDFNRISQPEASSFDRITFPESTSRDSIGNHTSDSPKLGRQSLDLRDLVKESMYRETRGPSNDVASKDSPRPLSVSKSVNGSYGFGVNQKQNVSADIKESMRVLAKLQDAAWYESNDASLVTNSKDHPRFSYDGRETNRPSFESRETLRSTRKLKDFPRLSLDSKDGSVRSLNSDSLSKSHSQIWRKGSDNSSEKTPIIPQMPPLLKRPPSVVAKLMGLEALPDSASTSDRHTELIKKFPVEDHDHDPFLGSAQTINLSRPICISDSPITSYKGPTSPRWQNHDSGMKPLSSSRFPIEPAPWKNRSDASRASLKPSTRHHKSMTRASNAYPSVYSEIENRLKDLEFKQSGKDLRALKQILEAMQAKGILETEREEQDSNYAPAKEYDRDRKVIDRNQKLVVQRNPNGTSTSTIRGSNSSRKFESPIVIMKPGKHVNKSGPSSSSFVPIDGLSGLGTIRNDNFSDGRQSLVNGRTAREHPSSSKYTNEERDFSSTSRNSDRNLLRKPQSSPKPRHLPKENTTSPRMQHKKPEHEKRCRPPIPLSDAGKSRKQPAESDLLGGKHRPKQNHVHQQSDDQLSEASNESRNLSHQEDDASVKSDGNSGGSLSARVAKHSLPDSLEIKSSPRFNEDGLSTDCATVSPQHPSPVSVLDASVYRDDLPSPVNMESSLQDDEPDTSIKSHAAEEQQFSSSDNVGSSGLSSEINRKKLQSIDHLVQKLRRLNSNHDEARTDYIASLCDKTSTDHRYISEILLASGLLLRDLGSTLTMFQLHPSSQPINPELFFVLEQTKATTSLSNTENVTGRKRSNPDNEKLHRKLIFSTVNEILIGKLGLLASSTNPCMKQPTKLATHNMTSQQLLREICTEIDQLQGNKMESDDLDEHEDGLKKFLSEDVYRSENWTNFNYETSRLILDVERSLFKELVDEIVRGESANLRFR